MPIDNVWEYDPATKEWKALAPLPTPRGSANAAVVNGKIYVIGGGGLHPGSKETAAHPARHQRRHRQTSVPRSARLVALSSEW